MTSIAKWLFAAAVAGSAISVALCHAQGPASTDTPGVAPIQPDVPLTMSALLGSVNGEPIFIDDVFKVIGPELRRLAAVPKATTEDFRAVARPTIAHQLDSLIGDILIYRAAKEAMTDDDQKRLELYLNKFTKDLLSRYAGSQAQADHALQAKGSSFEKEQIDARRHAIIDMYLHRTLWPKIVVTRAMVVEDYQRKIKQFTVPAEVDLYSITIPITRFLKEDDPANPGKQRIIKNPAPARITEATNQTVELARSLIAQLKAGKDFADLAQSYSSDIKKEQGGHWQRVQEGILRWKEVEAVAFALHPNSIADPVVVPDATDPAGTLVMIVRVDESTPGHIIPFAEAQAKIEMDLRQAQYVLQTNAYYRKLRENAAIDEAIEKMVETATDVAVARFGMK